MATSESMKRTSWSRWPHVLQPVAFFFFQESC